MKFATFLLTAVAASPALGFKFQGLKATSKGDDSDVAAPVSSGGSSQFPLATLEGVEYEPPLLKKAVTPGATITKLRYGPYTV